MSVTSSRLKGVGNPTLEGSLICHIVDKEDTHGTSVVCSGDGAKAFLARGVPNLQLDSLSIQLNRSNLEVDSNRRDE